MAGVIVPAAKAVYLCEEVDVEGGLTNLYGLFRRLDVPTLPYSRDEFCVFAQLSGGLGDLTTHVDIRRADDGLLIHATEPRVIRFDRRSLLVQVAFHVLGVTFPTAGVYLAELYCDNVWVADTNFEINGDQP
jgi:hypothetical protein